MANHVRILAWLNIVMGGFGVVLAVMTVAGASILNAIMAQVAETAVAPLYIAQLIATVVVAVILVLSLPSLIVGFGLYNFRPWARVLGLVLAAFNLVQVPFGTALALYTFWVLLKPETEQLFKQQPVA